MIGILRNWFAAGGPVMLALAATGLVLFFLVTHLYLSTRSELRRVRASARPSWDEFHLLRVSGMRRLGVIRACVLIAPLLGLLGTVVGVQSTFADMLAGGTVTGMGRGIGQALLTTQYGLCIAVPGLLAERLLRRRIDRIESMAHAGPPEEE
jgi:biopolymer transport protein ExbB